MKNSVSWLNLPSLALPLKALFTGYIMLVGIGLMMAGLQVLLTHGMADGKFGISVDDIVYSYYGNTTGSKLESKLNGSMKAHASSEDRLTIIKWARGGADKAEWETTVHPIVEQNCGKCHGMIPSLPDITDYNVAAKEAKLDEGATVSTLARVSHIHLFGISFIFFFIGFIFSLSVGFNKWVKSGLIIFPFLFLIVDISSWWLTKIDPGFAWLVIIGGIGYSIAAGVMLLTSLYQMWVMPLRQKHVDINAWEDDLS